MAFDAVKQHLTTKPALDIYRLDRPHVLQTDASNYQIGAVLMQVDDEGELYSAMYASRKLFPSEVRYAIPEKEALSVFGAFRNSTNICLDQSLRFKLTAQR